MVMMVGGKVGSSRGAGGGKEKVVDTGGGR